MLVRRVWPGRPAFNTSFSELDQFRREMLRLFDSVTGDAVSGGDPGVFPPLNITQDEDNVYVRAELPGIDADQLALTALRNRISLAGKREIRGEQERVSYHRKERAEGTFSRTLALPVEIDPERVEARYTDGILVLTLPKADVAKPRQITVTT
jgi:HSP20 family protein